MTDLDINVEPVTAPRSEKSTSHWRRFSLLNLLALMTAVAVWLPWLSLRGEPERLSNEIDMMNQAVGQLLIDDPTKIVAIELPDFDNRFKNWKVYLPDDQSVLRFAVDDIHDLGMPSEFESVSLTQGEHEISLKSESDKTDGFRWALYVDGKQVITKTRRASWIESSGSTSTRGTSKITKSFDRNEPLTLMKLRYSISLPTGKTSRTSLEQDRYQAAKGTLVWLDRQDRQTKPLSPWLDKSVTNMGSDYFGLRSGVRFGWLPSFEPGLRLFHPDTMSRRQPAAKLAMTFDGDGTWPGVSTRNRNLGDWKLSDQPDEVVPLTLTKGDQEQRLAYLHYQPKTDGLRPVVEIRFDLARPNEVGFRLLPTQGERKILRWTLQAISGKTYRWRELPTKERILSIKDLDIDPSQADGVLLPSTQFIEDNNAEVPNVEVRLESSVTKLGGLAARTIPHATRLLGFSSKQSWIVPQAAHARVDVRITDRYEDAAKTLIPGGKVLSEVHVIIDDPKDEVIRYRIEVDPLVKKAKL